jgi:enoyl-CoA hydratase/carnithine racemase
MGVWKLERHGAVAVLTFNRPPQNMLDIAASDELAARLAELAQLTKDVSVVLLTGAMNGYFIAHFDIPDLARIGRGEVPKSAIAGYDRALAWLEQMPQPTIAAIDGQAWGGGSELALACSLRIGSERVNLGQPEVRVGLIPGAGGTQRLQRLIGRGAAYDIILGARIVKADEALRLGWLNAVLPVKDFRNASIQWATEIARHPAEALFAAKRALGLAHRVPQQDLDQERELFWGLVESSTTFKARAAQDEGGRASATGAVQRR